MNLETATETTVEPAWALAPDHLVHPELAAAVITGGAAAKYTVSSSDTMTAPAGAALAGHLVLSVWKEITMAVPPGGYEEFPVADYWARPRPSPRFRVAGRR